ncbi:MAG: hypothetical protein ACREV8_09805, partial [Gammaproteobacteria bacterium]
MKGAVRERELPLAILLALTEQEAGALLDILDHHTGLVLAVVQERAERAHQPAFSDIGRAFDADIFLVGLESQFLQ